MRIGKNPAKDKKLTKSNYHHQVIVPVYIPNTEGYFKDSFKILQICLSSLFKTIHSNTFITVVNNGSSEEVSDYLDALYKENKINEVIHTGAIGKINAILKGLVGHNFPLVTISDADVLFLNHWQKATYEVFENFPKTGVVCTTPSPKSFKYINNNLFFDCFFSKKLQIKKVANPKALKLFAHSIGNPNFYNKTQLEFILTVNNNNFTGVVGAGHFSATYRRELFDSLSKTFTSYNLGGNSVNDFLDIPVIKKGYWRLSTYNNYTYHLGNIQENWMETKLEELKPDTKPFYNLSLFKPDSKWQYLIKNKVFAQFFKSTIFYHNFLIKKGLSKQNVKSFFS